MKKKFLAAVSLLVAIVMSFSLFACRKDGSSDVPQGPLTSDKAAESVGSLLTDSYIGTAKLKLSSKLNEEGEEYSVDFEKRGDKLKMTVDTSETIFDLKTGYFYKKTAAGYTGEQAIDAGVIDYYVDLFKASVSGADLSSEADMPSFVSYDESTGVLKVDIDAEDAVNEFLKPLSDAAASDTATLEDLLNEYLKVYGKYLGVTDTDNVTVSSLLDTAGALIVTNKDVKLGALIDAAEAANEDLDVKATIKELGASFGVTVTDTMYNLIRNRKIGEMVVSVATYIGGLQGLEDISPMDVVNAILFDTADTADIAQSLTVLKTMAIGVLRGYKVKDLVEMLGSMGNPVLNALYSVIKNSVQFTALDFKAEVKFDADFNVSKLTIDAKAAHNYTGTPINGALLLSDNDYTCKAELEITEYTDETAPFEMTFAPTAGISEEEELSAIVADNVNADVKVYFETFGKSVAVSDLETYYLTNDYNVAALTGASATYDAATSTFTVPASLIKSAIAKTDFAGAIVISGSTGGSNTVSVVISVAPSDPEEAQSQFVEQLITVITQILPM